MLTIDAGDDGVLHVCADGQLSTDDYIDFVTHFEWFMAGRSGPIDLLIEIGTNFGGWSLDTLFRDQNFAMKPTRSIRRIAIVGDERWAHWATGASYAALADEIQFFDRATRGEATAWLEQAGAAKSLGGPEASV
jgi:hypothetical protein